MFCFDTENNKVKCERSSNAEGQRACAGCKIITPTFDYIARNLANRDDLPLDKWREQMEGLALIHITGRHGHSTPRCLVNSYLNWRSFN